MLEDATIVLWLAMGIDPTKQPTTRPSVADLLICPPVFVFARLRIVQAAHVALTTVIVITVKVKNVSQWGELRAKPVGCLLESCLPRLTQRIFDSLWEYAGNPLLKPLDISLGIAEIRAHGCCTRYKKLRCKGAVNLCPLLRD